MRNEKQLRITLGLVYAAMRQQNQKAAPQPSSRDQQ